MRSILRIDWRFLFVVAAAAAAAAAQHRCTKWNENERPRMLEVVRVLESYLPPEPAKTSVLYQTLAYCEKQLQSPEQNWTVASAIRSISTDVQLKSPANSSPHRAVPHRAMLPESQPEPRTQSIAKGSINVCVHRHRQCRFRGAGKSVQASIYVAVHFSETLLAALPVSFFITCTVLILFSLLMIRLALPPILA